MAATGTLPNPGRLSGSLSNANLRGYSAYDIAVEHGFEGTEEEWLASLTGDGIQIQEVKDALSKSDVGLSNVDNTSDAELIAQIQSTYVDSCESDDSSVALAASQGKILQDQITELINKVNYIIEYLGIGSGDINPDDNPVDDPVDNPIDNPDPSVDPNEEGGDDNGNNQENP